MGGEETARSGRSPIADRPFSFSDHEGRFSPSSFDAAFSRFGAPVDGAPSALTWRATRAMLAGNALLKDPVGWFAAFLEWGALFYVGAQQLGGPVREKEREEKGGGEGSVAVDRALF